MNNSIGEWKNSRSPQGEHSPLRGMGGVLTVGDVFESVFCELVTVDVVGIGSCDLIAGGVEADILFECRDDVVHGFLVGLRHFIAIGDECRLSIEYGLTEGLFLVVFSCVFTVVFLGFGHSSPPIKGVSLR